MRKKKKIAILFCLILMTSLRAQDERFFRQLFSGELDTTSRAKAKKQYHFRANSPFYEFDLDGDNRNESFVLEKKDGENWLHIHAYGNEKKRIFSHKFTVLGPQSQLYKISVRELSSRSKVLLLHFFEGVNKYIEMRGTSRIYFLTIDQEDLDSLAVSQGPIIWDEFRSSQGHYHQRPYKVSLFDYNKDGVRELSVKHHKISEVFFYLGKGKWESR